jgi:hypothetical protein
VAVEFAAPFQNEQPTAAGMDGTTEDPPMAILP